MEEGLFQLIGKNIVDPKWWAGEIPSYLIFSALAGFVVWLVTLVQHRLHRRRYDDWRLVTIFETEEAAQDLFWEEVERVLNSDFERWKMVKSVVSGVGHTSLTMVRDAESGDPWVVTDHGNRTIRIDLDKAMTRDHLAPHPARAGKAPMKPGAPL